MKSTWIGRWRIVETDLWGDDSIDLLEQAHIELGPDGLGYLIVGALQADVDYRVCDRDRRPVVEFSWLGDDDGHPASGRGWAQLDADRKMRVELYIHRGDEAKMLGVPTAPRPRRGAPTGEPARGSRRRR